MTTHINRGPIRAGWGGLWGGRCLKGDMAILMRNTSLEKKILNDERYSLKIFIPGIVRGKSFSSQISLV